MALILFFSGCLTGNGQAPPYEAIISSDFYLVQGGVLALDNDIQIHMYSWEESPVNYAIFINNVITETGNFTYTMTLDYRIKQSFVEHFKIIINGSTVIDRYNIIIYDQNYYSVGTSEEKRTDLIQIGKDFVTDMKQEQFFAIMTAFILAVPFAIWGTKDYKISKGVYKLPLPK